MGKEKYYSPELALLVFDEDVITTSNVIKASDDNLVSWKKTWGGITE